MNATFKRILFSGLGSLSLLAMLAACNRPAETTTAPAATPATTPAAPPAATPAPTAPAAGH